MLQFLRKPGNVKKIMWGLAILIIPAFVLWGSGSTARSRRAPRFAGVIFGDKVSFQEYEAAFAAVRTDALLRYGQALNKIVQFLNFEELTWERLIILNQAQEKKIKVDDQEVVSFIQSLPIFQTDGAFNQGRYNSIVAYSFRLNPREFEEQMRQELLIEKMRSEVTKDIAVTDEEAEKEYAQRNEQAKAAYVFFGPEPFQAEISASEEEIRAYYEEHKEELKKPEQVNVIYAGLLFERAQELFPQEVSEEEIEEYFQGHLDEFKPKEETVAAIEEGGVETEQPLQAEEPAEEEDQDDELILPSEETKALIKERLAKEKAREALEDKVWQVADEVSENVPEFEQIAKSHQLEIKETGFFQAQEPVAEIGLSYEFAQAAFALKLNEVSDVINTPQGAFVLKLKEKKPASIAGFDEVREQAAQAVIKQKALKLAEEKAKEALAQLKELTQDNKATFQKAAEKLSLEVKDTEAITRTSYISGIGRSQEFAEAVFSLVSGQISEVIAVPNGYCIASLAEIIPIDKEKFAQEKESFKETLLAKKKSEFYLSWLDALKAKAELNDYVAQFKSETQP